MSLRILKLEKQVNKYSSKFDQIMCLETKVPTWEFRTAIKPKRSVWENLTEFLISEHSRSKRIDVFGSCGIWCWVGSLGQENAARAGAANAAAAPAPSA
jgi:hypothetical protein